MINQWLNWNTIRRFFLQADGLVEKPRLATTGWRDESLVSEQRPNFIRVRFTDDKSEAEVYNDSVPAVTGVQVLVYKGLDGILRARHPSKNYTLRDLAFSFIKNHGDNHDYYGVDPVLVQTRAMLSLHPHIADKWSIRVRPGWVVFGRRPYWFTGDTVSLLAHRSPAGGSRYVLLSTVLQKIGGITTVKMIVTPGKVKETLIYPDDFPDIPDGHYAICAVRVRSDKRKLGDTRGDSDIYDLRLSGGGPGGPGSHHSEPLCYNGEICYFNSDVIVMEVKS